MKEAFENKNFHPKTLGIINLCDDILTDYSSQGYDLSLRQLYYQLVARGHIENSQRSYTNLGNIVNDGRLAGLLDWNTIVDRGRATIKNSHWSSPNEILQSCIYSFKIDKWENQSNHVEVMVEKQALEGVIQPVCSKLDVNFTANKGYSSQSFMYRKGQLLEDRHEDGKEIHVIYLGDHDPSGLDMDRDIFDRLSLFSQGTPIHVKRIALTMEQVEELNPPENPAKLSDTRAKAYINEYGYSSWELDAIEPDHLARLVTEAVTDLRDPDLWDDSVKKENGMKQELEDMIK